MNMPVPSWGALFPVFNQARKPKYKYAKSIKKPNGGNCPECGDSLLSCARCFRDFKDGDDVIHCEDDFGERDHFCKSCG
jgi:hypothetical protein